MFFSKDLRVRVGGIIIENNRLLLIAHKKDHDIYWLVPGGGVEFGESLDEALRREFIEELNIRIQTHSLAMVFDSIEPSGKRHIVNICFYCSCESGNIQIGEEKRLHDYAFYSLEELKRVPMYPPINRDLQAILNKDKHEIYLGKKWLEK